MVANLFDDSGSFRQRNGSFKRQRTDGGGFASGDGYYDLSRDASTPSLPPAPKIDVGKIRGLLVKANETATTIRTRYVYGWGGAGRRAGTGGVQHGIAGPRQRGGGGGFLAHGLLHCRPLLRVGRRCSIHWHLVQPKTPCGGRDCRVKGGPGDGVENRSRL